ncbi:hypothetical protein FIBSPDRAFT_738470 [Athelia psychrophila]|uniref:Methyltransferase domain-containing protein n=1 Tax=Athelia psychrophila TaxID=1759441 RepID=A0A166LAL0_9AGAM|nr:hypothetical protein FIBSPDRAFT_738470 [Fibularhizoctonia sp. CBS 109695]
MSGKYTPELDHEFYYALAPHEMEFLRQQTGISDDAKLKAHLVALQEKAYKASADSAICAPQIHPYACIRRFAFTTLKIAGQPVYPDVLKLGKERKNAVLLDIGCCFGNDLRKVVADGFPITGVIGADLHKDFWDLGHELYMDLDSFLVPFIEGNVFDVSLIDPTPPTYSRASTPPPALSSLTSLNPLRGHVSAIHASSLFHLFDEAHQLKLAQALAALLSTETGSVIFGSHNGLHEDGFKSGSRRERMFCHSPQSWEALWNGGIFKKGQVKVEAKIVDNMRKDPSAGDKPVIVLLLVWSVTRCEGSLE